MSRQFVVKPQLEEESGIKDFSIELIQRGGDDSNLFYDFKSGVKLPESLISLVPMGNPPEFQAGYIEKDKSYLSIFYTRDNAVNVIVELKEKHYHPIFSLASITEGLNQMMDLPVDSDIDFSYKITRDFDFNYDKLSKLKNLSSLIYSFLAKRKIVIAGDKGEAISIISSLINLLPEQHNVGYGFIFNIHDFQDPFVNFYCFEDKHNVNYKQQVQELVDLEFDLIALENHVVYAELDSDICNSISEMILEDKEISTIKKKVSQFLDLAQQYKKFDEDEIVDKTGISYSDAQLLIEIIGDDLHA